MSQTGKLYRRPKILGPSLLTSGPPPVLLILILKIPYWMFYVLLKIYALFDSDPPFTADQLKALVAGDVFPVDNWCEEFNVEYTGFSDALKETHTHPEYSKYILEF